MIPANLLATSVSIALLACALPAFADVSDDRFTLRLGAIHAEGTGALFGSTGSEGDSVSFDESFGLGSREIAPRIDGAFRISQRNRLIFDYFRYAKDARQTLTGDLPIGDVVIPAGSTAEVEARFHLASLIYEFSIIDSPTFSAGVQIGAEYARLDAELLARDGETRHRRSEDIDGYAPVVGLRLSATPGQRWLISAQAQHLDAGWGNFDRDFDGSIKRANAIAEFRLTAGLGVFAGYDYFKVNYQRSGRDGSGSIDLKFRGPTAGVSLAF